jgi:hypothetical protein
MDRGSLANLVRLHPCWRASVPLDRPWRGSWLMAKVLVPGTIRGRRIYMVSVAAARPWASRSIDSISSASALGASEATCYEAGAPIGLRFGWKKDPYNKWAPPSAPQPRALSSLPKQWLHCRYQFGKERPAPTYLTLCNPDFKLICCRLHCQSGVHISLHPFVTGVKSHRACH